MTHLEQVMATLGEWNEQGQDVLREIVEEGATEQASRAALFVATIHLGIQIGRSDIGDQVATLLEPIHAGSGFEEAIAELRADLAGETG